MGDLISVLTDNLDEFLSGFWVTVRLVVFSFVIAIVVGTLVAALRISPNKMLQRLGGVYVETFRNIEAPIVMSDTDVRSSAWRAIAAATALNAPLGSLYAFSVFLKPLETLLGLSRADLESALEQLGRFAILQDPTGGTLGLYKHMH